MFCSNFSRVHIFCNDDRLKLVPESTQIEGFQSLTIVNNITGNQKVNF